MDRLREAIGLDEQRQKRIVFDMTYTMVSELLVRMRKILNLITNYQNLIDTGESTFMAVQDFHDIDADPHWMSWSGRKYTPKELVEHINLMAPGNSDIVINVHEFRD